MYDLNKRIKDKMQVKLDGFKKHDLVSIDTESLKEMSVAQESKIEKKIGDKQAFEKERRRMDALFRRLSSQNSRRIS